MGAHIDRPGATTDAELISRSLSQPQVFGGIFDRHFTAVHRYIARRAGHERADDLASQTFIVAFERRATFRAGDVIARPWLLGIATNLLRNDWRSEKRLLETLARVSAHPAVGLSSNGAATAEVDAELAAALASLDVDQRDVLLLHAWEELSYEEIAAVLEIPIGTVRSRLSRARSHLQSRLLAAPTVPAGTQTREET